MGFQANDFVIQIVVADFLGIEGRLMRSVNTIVLWGIAVIDGALGETSVTFAQIPAEWKDDRRGLP